MTFLKELTAMFGPVLICWFAVNIAFIAGKSGNWWPVLMAMLICGSAIMWASSVAEARAKSGWAVALVTMFMRGGDTTITVEHFHSDATKGERP